MQVSYSNKEITYSRFRTALKKWESFIVFNSHNECVFEGYYDKLFKDLVMYDKNHHFMIRSMKWVVYRLNDDYESGSITFYDSAYLNSRRYIGNED